MFCKYLTPLSINDTLVVGIPTTRRTFMITKEFEKKREYDVKIDEKKRITLRGANYDYYHVVVFSNGKIELSPRVLVDPFEISEDSLKMIDKSMENLKKGVASAPIDLSGFED